MTNILPGGIAPHKALDLTNQRVLYLQCRVVELEEKLKLFYRVESLAQTAVEREIDLCHDFADLISAVETFLTRFINPGTKLTDYERRYLNEIRAIVCYMKDEVPF